MDDLLKKLRYGGQSPVLLTGVPEELGALRPALEAAGARVDTQAQGAYAWALVFVRSLAETADVVRDTESLIDGDGILWLAYPKQSSKRYSADVDRDKAWALFEGTPARLVAQTALDVDWSAVRVRKREFVKQ